MVGWLELLIQLSLVWWSSADGSYSMDFNSTLGLSFVGDARTTSCEEHEAAGDDHPAYGYDARHGLEVPPMTELRELDESSDESVSETTTMTTPERESGSEPGQGSRAGFGHRSSSSSTTSSEDEDCAVRLRLTGPAPAQTGAVWLSERANVLQGFSTVFSFQLTSLSRSCRLVRDASFSWKKYESCTVHGGDGLAFVVHGDDADVGALGDSGADMGFGGLRNALAVELDIWYNPEAGDVVLRDHVTVLASQHGEALKVAEHQLHAPVVHDLADGAVHTMRVVYFPYLNMDLKDFFRTSDRAQKLFVKDMGEGYRLGTLAIWMDGATDPIVALPINLSAILQHLPENKAVVGFTAATGRSWAAHDVLAWTFCEDYQNEDCQ